MYKALLINTLYSILLQGARKDTVFNLPPNNTATNIEQKLSEINDEIKTVKKELKIEQNRIENHMNHSLETRKLVYLLESNVMRHMSKVHHDLHVDSVRRSNKSYEFLNVVNGNLTARMDDIQQMTYSKISELRKQIADKNWSLERSMSTERLTELENATYAFAKPSNTNSTEISENSTVALTKISENSTVALMELRKLVPKIYKELKTTRENFRGELSELKSRMNAAVQPVTDDTTKMLKVFEDTSSMDSELNNRSNPCNVTNFDKYDSLISSKIQSIMMNFTEEISTLKNLSTLSHYRTDENVVHLVRAVRTNLTTDINELQQNSNRKLKREFEKDISQIFDEIRMMKTKSRSVSKSRKKDMSQFYHSMKSLKEDLTQSIRISRDRSFAELIALRKELSEIFEASQQGNFSVQLSNSTLKNISMLYHADDHIVDVVRTVKVRV